MPPVLDIEQAVLLLEIEPPFDKREIQLARRRMAKIWHPDIAPPGKQLEHERHLKAVNEAADREKHDPFASRVPDHSVVHRYARCLSYPEWGVGNVNGIYFTGDGDDIQQWARVGFQVGIRTVPAGSLQF